MAEKILVVDDEMDIVRTVQLCLMAEGYETLAAHTGEDALQQAAGEKPDAVIMDVMMPGMDGFEALKRLKENTVTAHIPVIMLTARDRYADIAKGQKWGCDFYCNKPFSPSEIVSIVKRALAV